MKDEITSVRALLSAIGFCFVAPGIQSMVDHGMAENQRAWGSLAIGIVLGIMAFAWPRIQSVLSPRLVESAGRLSSNFGVWLGIVAIIWLYGAITSIILLKDRNELEKIIREDIAPFRLALQRWVIPRHLTPEQIDSIARYLSNVQPYTVTFNVTPNDEEASSYRADFQRAITTGGWTVSGINYKADIPEGLTIYFLTTMATSQRPDDPRNPKPNDILQQANVQVEGSGGGSGINTTQDVLSVNIGKRRSTLYARPQPWPF